MAEAGSSQGLSAGAAAGIGICATLFLLLVVCSMVLAVILIGRARRRCNALMLLPPGRGLYGAGGKMIITAIY